MKKNFISFLCSVMCCTIIFGQANTNTTAFTGCPNVYVAGFKNGTNCTAATFTAYTVNLNGSIINALFTLPSNTLELNGIGISRQDSRGYALLFDRIANPATPPNPPCLSSNIRLIRFGANGNPEILGNITPPSGGVVLTPLGAIDANGNYYFGATNSTGTQFYVGKISNLSSLPAGALSVSATYTPVALACPAVFADWAVNPMNNSELYSYGIYNAGTPTMQRPTGTLVKISLTTNSVTCTGIQTQNSAYFTDTSDDNFAGVMYGADGFLYGVNVKDRRIYSINPATGAISPAGTLAGGASSDQLRGDFGSCASLSTPIQPFPCSKTNASYIIGFKNGTNCTKAGYSVYTTNLSGQLSPTPLFTTPDTIEVNGLGVSLKDGYGYGLTYLRNDNKPTGTSACSIDTIKFFRFGANGMRETLGYLLPNSIIPSVDLNTAVGTMDANGNYYLIGNAGTQPYFIKISNTDTLTSIPNRSIAYTPTRFYIDACSGGKIFADWAINPLNNNELYTYGIYTNRSGQVVGQVLKLDLAAQNLYCSGSETTGVFTNENDDNFGGIVFGTDNYLYGVNVFTRKFYRINATTGAINYVSTFPADGSGTPTTSQMRVDMASCVTSPGVLPLGFDKPLVTSLGECKAALSWKVSGVEIGDVFVVEKSFDGKNFTTLSTIKATTEGTNEYNITDSKTGITNYYRIQGISKNGDTKYSPIVRFLSSCGGKNNVTLFQNLLSGGTMISGEISLYKSQPVTATVYNATGVQVFNKTSTASAGVSRFNYNISSLSKGVYLLQTIIGQERFTEKFIVQ